MSNDAKIALCLFSKIGSFIASGIAIADLLDKNTAEPKTIKGLVFRCIAHEAIAIGSAWVISGGVEDFTRWVMGFTGKEFEDKYLNVHI